MTTLQILGMLIRAQIHICNTSTATTAADDYASKVLLDGAISRVHGGR